jgi:hypothetical protein
LTNLKYGFIIKVQKSGSSLIKNFIKMGKRFTLRGEGIKNGFLSTERGKMPNCHAVTEAKRMREELKGIVQFLEMRKRRDQ